MSACHWCHVMERESFRDENIARLLNKYFVSIKVDREERPDIDKVYMQVCQALRGDGGWPLNLFLTPSQKPFFAGAYFPVEDSRGSIGLRRLVENVWHAWESDRESLVDTAGRITENLNRAEAFRPREIEESVLQEGYSLLKSHFDPKYGGFGHAPKFPMPHMCMFLLRYSEMFRRPHGAEMAGITLVSIYRGGIHDHIGGGYCRYSTDEKWLIPHFEKMLYDNALIAYAFLEAAEVCGGEFYLSAAMETLNFILRELRGGHGGFFSAISAESGGREGDYYIWTPSQIKDCLGERAAAFCERYGITRQGNFEGGSLPNLIGAAGLSQWEEDIEKLRREREKREKPPTDDKVLTGWNGLAIAALARAGRMTGRGEYLEAAIQSAEFVRQKLTTPEGRLLARYRGGEAAFLGYLDDYAFLTWGLLEIFEATGHREYLNRALRLAQDSLKLFDDNGRGLFFYGDDGEDLIARTKEGYDGALPSGNAIAAWNFKRLSRAAACGELAAAAQQIFTSLGESAAQYPAGHSALFYAWLR